ncbi:MAG: SLBB domain-containing protein [Tolumonas sp.]|nr:SLBB domain-containing protein [Tolumonas sp.]
MKTKTLSITFLLTALLAGSGVAADISPAMLAQFKQLPAAQQQALAAQYGVDLNSITGSSKASVPVVAAPTIQPREIKPEQVSQRSGSDNQKLQPFGYNIFAGQPTSLAPVGDIPVPDDYIVGPGDEIKVQLFGKENSSLSMMVGREGSIDFPKLGPINIAGLTFQEVKDDLQNRIAKQYIGVESSITFGSLRTMQIFVMGDAYKPGAYNVNALTTVTQALLIAGGIDTVGSLRNIQVKRGKEVIQNVDLYNMLLSGDTSQDIRLTAGDTLFVAPKGKEVSVSGLVKRPAIYELSGATSLTNVLDMAGGIKASALQEVTVVRSTQQGNRVYHLNASGKGGAFAVKDGDSITVNSVSTENPTAISVKGAVIHEGIYSYQPGLRVSQIIQNKARDLQGVADLDYSLLIREINARHDIKVEQFSIGKAITAPGGLDDLVLQPHDQILIFTANMAANPPVSNPLQTKDTDKQIAKGNVQLSSNSGDLVNKETGQTLSSGDQPLGLNVSDKITATDVAVSGSRQVLLAPIIERLKFQASRGQPVQIAEVRGEVKYPGTYPITAQMHTADLITAAGGLQESAYVVELSRINEQLNSINLSHQRIDLRDAMNKTTSPLVLSKDSMNVLPHPDWREEATVQVFGEVKFPGTYIVKRGESLSQLISRVGGLTTYANPKGTIFAREELRKLENQRLEFLRNQMRQEISTLALRRQTATAAYTVPPTEAMSLVNQLENTQAIGRLAINMPAILDGDKQADVMLENGDKVYIPSMQNVISIMGQVQYPSSQAFDASFSMDDYIERAGGTKKQADTDRTYVIKADGSVMLPSSNYWFSRKSRNLEPGDSIVVPLDTDYMDSLSTFSTATQMMYQLGVAWSAIK